MSLARFMVVVGLIVLAAIYRLVPYEPSLSGLLPYFWNLAPVGAMSLIAGATIKNRLLAFAVPLTVLLLSDVMIGMYLNSSPFYDGWWVNYAAFGVYVLIGFWLRNRRQVYPISGAALAGSIQFFLVSNFGVWALGSIYPKTWAGLVDCYIAGIPFSRGTFIGDQVFAFALFGAFALIEWGFPRLREPALQPA